jgi:hypothetical protein
VARLFDSEAAASSPIETPVFNPDTGSSHSLSVSITTTHANDLAIANQIGGSSWDSGWTAAPAGQTAYGELNEYKQVTTTGTYTAWAGQSATGGFFLLCDQRPLMRAVLACLTDAYPIAANPINSMAHVDGSGIGL